MARVKTSPGTADAAPPATSIADGVAAEKIRRSSSYGVSDQAVQHESPYPTSPGEPHFAARAGDVLVVSYPEVAVPIAPYFTVRVGGLTYSRQLVAGEDAGDEYDKVYAFLQGRAERDAAAKVRLWAEEQAAAAARRGK